MDETPIKAGRLQSAVPRQPGRMKQGYFWPVYGERDDVFSVLPEPRRGARARRFGA
jgi:hypothetical protein